MYLSISKKSTSSCQQNLKVVASFETSGCSLFFVVAPSYGQPNPNSDKWINVDKIIAVREGKIVTTSDVYILEKIAFCHGHNLKSTVFQIEDDTDYFFLYLLTLSLISEASSLYIIEEREITAFLEADDSTKKSLQNTDQDVKATYDCSMNEIDSRRVCKSQRV